MKIALIGASGFVGSAILNEALERGFEVTAIVQNVDKLPKHPKLTAKKADAYNAADIATAVAGHDAVISAFNPGWGKPDIGALFLKGFNAITAGVKQAGVKRYLAVGGAGSLFIAPGLQLVDTPEFPAEWKEGALAAREALNLIKNETSLDWSFVSPAVFLEPGERTGKYRLGLEEPLFGDNGPAKISTADLAVAIIDEVETPKHIQKRFTAAY
ncbi:NAD(P)-dependent oxidoreductase [Andreprevotia chitinilytica]|uniref:NAD(P)-dependent oxidoreductase n=1 Tax=Andreprevotia chitinilytica TaxID=396808 RepID=UPI0005588F79|nr:NAD(P)-dependent oxidoreductase [Andreprevotia chitinilytica]